MKERKSTYTQKTLIINTQKAIDILKPKQTEWQSEREMYVTIKSKKDGTAFDPLKCYF